MRLKRCLRGVALQWGCEKKSARSLRSGFFSVTLRAMETVLRYRGRDITGGDVAFIERLIADNPSLSRYALSKKLCKAWDWCQPNGSLRDMVARSLMLELHRAGHIELPPPRFKPRNPLAERAKPERVLHLEWKPIKARVGEIRPLEFRQVRRTAEEPLFNSLIETHHYLGYTQPVGEHLKYMIYARGTPVACMAWSSAPRHIGPRDRFIGWRQAERRKNIHLISYNSRFLILPWVNVPHLASHILAQVARRISRDWEALYRHPIVYLETFVDTERFRGTCYRAANWRYLGKTTGRGKDDQTKKANRSLKDILGYPLSRRFRKHLSGVQ